VRKLKTSRNKRRLETDNSLAATPNNQVNRRGGPYGTSTYARIDRHKLDVYRCALELYRLIGKIISCFPRGESDLKGQMNRARRSVPFNIGEGVGKRGKARAASYEVALGEDKELMVALDCVEIDELAPIELLTAAQDLTDRIAAMLTRMIETAVECVASGKNTRRP